MRILVIEDNARLATLLERILRDAGFDVDHVADTREAQLALSAVSFAAILLDLARPPADALQFIRSLRARGDRTPILILSSLILVSDRIAGLQAGADDYLVKPFDADELTARVRTLLRRPHSDNTPMVLGNVTLSSGEAHALVNGSSVSLGPQGARVLEALMRRSGRIVTHEALSQALGSSGKALHAVVHRLRSQLARANADLAILTLVGVGYQLNEGRKLHGKV